MLCPSCGREYAGTAGLCSTCQAATQAVVTAQAINGRAAPPSMGALGLLGIGVVVLLAMLYAIFVPTDEVNASTRAGYRVGTFIGAMLFPTIVAYIVAGRRKVRNWRRFASFFFISGLVFLTMSWLGSVNSETPERHIGRLMREAAGRQPARNIGFGRQREFDDAVREQFRNLIQLNRDYMAAVESLNIKETAKLNSPETLADPDSAAEALKQLRAAYDLDSHEEQKVSEILEKLRGVMRSSSSSPATQQSMLNGFDKSVAAQTTRRRQLLSTEKAWIDAEDELYDFALQHRNGFKLTGSQIAIADDGIREQFNQKVTSEEALRTEFLKSKQQFSDEQAKLLGSYGLDMKAVGAQ